MEKINKAHNVYWCKDPIPTALKNDCYIMEADIIYTKDDLYLSHSYRPFKKLMYGTLEDVFLKPLFELKSTKTLYLYIEFKSGNLKIINKLYSLLKKYEKEDMVFLFSAKDKNWFQKVFQKRERALKLFMKKASKDLPVLYLNSLNLFFEVKNVDLYKFSLNHF